MKTIRKKINQIKTYAGKTGSLVLSVILVCAILPIQADAGYIIQGVCQVQTDAGGAGAVKTLDYGYEDNTYFSLRDIAMLLQNTDKAFSLEVTKSEVRLQPGSGYTPVGVENDTWEEGEDGEDSEKTDISLRLWRKPGIFTESMAYWWETPPPEKSITSIRPTYLIRLPAHLSS